MTLVYRAVWEDDWADPVVLLDDEFRTWSQSKGIDPIDIPLRGRHVQDQRILVDVRRADVEIGRALRCMLREVDDRGRIWTTTATALVDNLGLTSGEPRSDAAAASRSLWVDLECEDPSGARPDMAAPRLVKGLIANGGRPTSFDIPIRADARRLNASNIRELADPLMDPERPVPIAVFSPDLSADPPTTIRRADAAAGALAGLCLVYTVSPDGCDALNRLLPEGFGVYGGAVRLYLPKLRIDDPDDAQRHRWFPRRLIATHPRRAASMLTARMLRLKLHQPIPSAWDRLGGLLRRPSEEDVGLRAAEIADSRPTVVFTAERPELESEIQDLTKLLAEADLIREASEADYRRELERLEREIAEAESGRYDDADELELLRRELDGLRLNMRILARPAPEAGEDEPLDPYLIEVPQSVGEAVELANACLPFVEIPPAAIRNVDELEGTAKYLVWASTIWQGLIALNEYAEAKSNGEQPAGFKLWCDETSAWPSSKLAMTESKTVQTNDELRDQRLFPVASEVDQSGRIHMFAHLKIQAGGGDNIPRLYFHDDTDGATRGMHVGFIGPHRLVRNTRS